MKIIINKMVGTKDGVLCITGKGSLLLSFEKCAGQPLPSGRVMEIELCGDVANVTIGRTKVVLDKEYLKKANLL